jgi:hypothetical protein
MKVDPSEGRRDRSPFPDEIRVVAIVTHSNEHVKRRDLPLCPNAIYLRRILDHCRRMTDIATL